MPIIALARSEMEQEGEVDLNEKRLKVLAGLKIQEKKVGVLHHPLLILKTSLGD